MGVQAHPLGAMKRILPYLLVAVFVVLSLAMCSGCTTVAEYGIGGPPRNVCAGQQSYINDRIAGTDNVSLSVVRRFQDGDNLCR